jgi:hypothetical protein
MGQHRQGDIETGDHSLRHSPHEDLRFDLKIAHIQIGDRQVQGTRVLASVAVASGCGTLKDMNYIFEILIAVKATPQSIYIQSQHA